MKNRKIVMIALCLCFLTYCASRPTPRVPRKPTPQAASSAQEPLPYSYDEVWHAIYQASIAYSLKELSKEEGTVESHWIYDSPLSRYRFFITLASSTSPIEWTIDIQSQERVTEQSRWRWVEPSLDKEENIQNIIYENLEKNRAS